MVLVFDIKLRLPRLADTGPAKPEPMLSIKALFGLSILEGIWLEDLVMTNASDMSDSLQFRVTVVVYTACG